MSGLPGRNEIADIIIEAMSSTPDYPDAGPWAAADRILARIASSAGDAVLDKDAHMDCYQYGKVAARIASGAGDGDLFCTGCTQRVSKDFTYCPWCGAQGRYTSLEPSYGISSAPPAAHQGEPSEEIQTALRAFLHLVDKDDLRANDPLQGLPDDHPFELVWASEGEIDEETAKDVHCPVITAGQIRRARAALRLSASGSNTPRK